MFDLIIRGGTVYDGAGRPGIQADVAVSGGRIAAVEPLPAARAARVIDARGKWVTPGFIDIHRHADAAAFRPGFGELELRQGLTTIVNGNCGLSCAPVGPENLPAITSYLEPICGRVPPEAARETLAEYFAAQPAAPLHTGMLAGAGTIRASVAGYQVQRLEPEHYAAIHRRLEGALADGALGVSLGLGYAPECFYTTDELIRALAPLAGQSIPITVHMRQEGGGVVEAAREMVEVARALKAPVHISHLKAMGRDNWNRKIPQVLALLDRARQEGLDLSCDVYPYTAGSTQLLHILPPEFLAGGIEAIVRRLQDPDQRKLEHEFIALVTGQRIHQRVHGAPVFQIAAEADLQVGQAAPARQDGEQVRQCLGGMLVAAVSRVDDGDARKACRAHGRALQGMAHGGNVRVAGDDTNGIGHAFALGNAGSVGTG